MHAITWICKPFAQLNADELYAFIRLRNEVFVVEQNCVFQDADNKDQHCYHLSGYVNNVLVSYSRLAPAGVTYADVAIGRVVTPPAHRKHGFGKALMAKAVEQCNVLFGDCSIKIGAQLYLKKFYESFGFKQISQMYLEDNIPHIEMLLDQLHK